MLSLIKSTGEILLGKGDKKRNYEIVSKLLKWVWLLCEKDMAFGVVVRKHVKRMVVMTWCKSGGILATSSFVTSKIDWLKTESNNIQQQLMNLFKDFLPLKKKVYEIQVISL